jgi:hypothetical protein
MQENPDAQHASAAPAEESIKKVSSAGKSDIAPGSDQLKVAGDAAKQFAATEAAVVKESTPRQPVAAVPQPKRSGRQAKKVQQAGIKEVHLCLHACVNALCKWNMHIHTSSEGEQEYLHASAGYQLSLHATYTCDLFLATYKSHCLKLTRTRDRADSRL